MIDALSATLFHFLWEGALLALVPALALIFPSPRIRYGVACAAMLAMPVVFGVTFVLSIPQPGLQAYLLPELHPAAVVARGASSLPRTWNLAYFEQMTRWFIPFWIMGVALFYVRTLTNWMAVQRLRQASSIPAPAYWKQRVDNLASRLGIRRAIALLGSDLVDVPVVAGFLRPIIFVPAALFAGMPPEQLEYLLIHELAHIRRLDYVVNLVQKAVEGFLFYHPAVWWVSRILRTERENCCDDSVVAMQGNAHGYARVLASLEQRRDTPALAASGGNLAKRIARLLNRPSHFSAAPLLGLIGIALLTTAAWAALQEPPALQIPAPQPPAAPGIHRSAYTRPQQPAARQTRAIVPETPSPFAKWESEDVAYIITSAERAAFEKLPSEEERAQFIEQFWLRRDPTPGTVANEMKDEHYRRIAYANDHFSAAVPGWQTDRGRIYISFGPPDEIDSHAQEHFEEWKYRYLEGIGTDVPLRFEDPEHNGSFHLISAKRGLEVKIVHVPGGVAVSVPLDPAKKWNVVVRVTTQSGKTVATIEKGVEYQTTFEIPLISLHPGPYVIRVVTKEPGLPDTTASLFTSALSVP